MRIRTLDMLQKSSSRYLTSIFALCIFSYATARFCHHQTKGFAVSKITKNLHEKELNVLVSEEEELLANRIFSQNLRYLGRGKQSFAFVSEDDQYVVKIFNNCYQHKIHLFKCLSKIPFLDRWAEQRAHYFASKLDKTFLSYQIAFEEMKENTALCYVHLTPSSHLISSMTLIDPLKISHEIDPNSIGFVIQKKVDLVYPSLEKMITEAQMTKAKQAICSLIQLFFWKFRHGIADNDPLIRTNYGFLEGQAIQIDIGPLSKDTSVQLKSFQKKEIQKVSSSLRSWLEKKCPDLIPFLDRELEEQLSYPL